MRSPITHKIPDLSHGVYYENVTKAFDYIRKKQNIVQINVCTKQKCTESNTTYCAFLLSLPSRERGLKLRTTGINTKPVHVAPFAGAWIEIIIST